MVIDLSLTRRAAARGFPALHRREAAGLAAECEQAIASVPLHLVITLLYKACRPLPLQSLSIISCVW